jgi:hypothetical protein
MGVRERRHILDGCTFWVARRLSNTKVGHRIQRSSLIPNTGCETAKLLIDPDENAVIAEIDLEKSPMSLNSPFGPRV